MSCAMTMRPFTTTSRPSCTRQRSTVVCQASTGVNNARRAITAALLAFPVIAAPKAMAILLDEDDEEMIEKAKANRKARLASQRSTTREFMKSEGLTNRELEKQLVPVQVAVYKLAKSGSQLESGDVAGAAATLSEAWVDEFKQATDLFASSPEAVLSGIASLKTATSSSDLKASKQQFVFVVSAVESWAVDAGVSGSLKGL